MWGLWIFLCAVFFTESGAYNTVEVQHGSELVIQMPRGIEKLDFMSQDRNKNYTIWSSKVKPKRGKVELMSDNNWRFIVNSANFDDQGDYILQDYSKFSTVTKVKVITAIKTQTCASSKTLSISLDGLAKNAVSLSFHNLDMDFKLVNKGSLEQNLPFYYEQVKVTSSNIQVSNVNEAGRYTLFDGSNRKAKIITVKVTDPRPTIRSFDLNFGTQLSIRLPGQAQTLKFRPGDESASYPVWSSSGHLLKGEITGSGSDRRFVINTVNFDDQGNYTMENNQSTVTSITRVKVHSATDTKKPWAGESLSISLVGLNKNEASLTVNKQEKNVMLVNKGSPVPGLSDYSDRIIVTDSNIQVLNLTKADEGIYTVLDVKSRKANVVTLKLNEPVSWRDVGIGALVLSLLGIPICACCYCKKKKSQKSSNTTTDPRNLLASPDTSSSPVATPPNPAYAPGYPAPGAAQYPNAIPLQQQYPGQPVMPPNPVGYTPGYPSAAVYPPIPNPTGYPAP